MIDSALLTGMLVIKGALKVVPLWTVLMAMGSLYSSHMQVGAGKADPETDGNGATFKVHSSFWTI